MKAKTKISSIVYANFAKISREGVGFLDTNIDKCIEEINELFEQQELIHFMRTEVKVTAPIVEFYKGCIILAQNEEDLNRKQIRIRRGDTLGFYNIDRIKAIYEQKHA